MEVFTHLFHDFVQVLLNEDNLKDLKVVFGLPRALAHRLGDGVTHVLNELGELRLVVVWSVVPLTEKAPELVRNVRLESEIHRLKPAFKELVSLELESSCEEEVSQAKHDHKEKNNRSCDKEHSLVCYHTFRGKLTLI